MENYCFHGRYRIQWNRKYYYLATLTKIVDKQGEKTEKKSLVGSEDGSQGEISTVYIYISFIYTK